MQLEPVKLSQNSNQVNIIKKQDYLYYSEHPELNRENLHLSNIHLVTFVHKEDRSINLLSLAGGENVKTFDELINNNFWFHVSIPKEFLEKYGL